MPEMVDDGGKAALAAAAAEPQEAANVATNRVVDYLKAMGTAGQSYRWVTADDITKGARINLLVRLDVGERLRTHKFVEVKERQDDDDDDAEGDGEGDGAGVDRKPDVAGAAAAAAAATASSTILYRYRPAMSIGGKVDLIQLVHQRANGVQVEDIEDSSSESDE